MVITVIILITIYLVIQWALKDVADEIPGLHDIDTGQGKKK
jgi:hypothetical protein